MQRPGHGPKTLTIPEKALKWLHHCKGSDRGFERGVFLNGVGAGRLEDMAVRSNLLSVALWKHFATAYSDEYPWTGDVYTAVPILELDVLFDLIPGALGSPGGFFLTSLSLVSNKRRRPDPGFDREIYDVDEPSVELTRAQWVQITTLDNLAVLKIHGSFGASLVDQVVRAWAHRSIVDGALSRLQVLALLDQDTLTLASLLELAKVKSLAVVQWGRRDITGVERFGQYGWKLVDDHVFEDHQQGLLHRPLLEIRCGPKASSESMRIVTLAPDSEWKAPRKRQLDDRDIDTARPVAPSKRPTMRKGARKDAAALLDQFSGM
ncbi:hypothetical protein BLS_000478 [Venturia inaequalis]|uniref:Uncharacterized protein n=1 Tax=Venturia inaequalis TaxID=5025 RepID=A0A8H3UY76_VENIN|nr:hypothetical protein BLS_000478 [Venturia inaequalis]